jgi:hypothetical protein
MIFVMIWFMMEESRGVILLVFPSILGLSLVIENVRFPAVC